MKDPFLLKGETCKLCHFKNHVAWCSFLWREWKAVFPQYENSSSSSQSPYQMSELIPIVTKKHIFQNYLLVGTLQRTKIFACFLQKKNTLVPSVPTKNGFDIENLDKKTSKVGAPASYP